jgi:hypothetical protein
VRRSFALIAASILTMAGLLNPAPAANAVSPPSPPHLLGPAWDVRDRIAGARRWGYVRTPSYVHSKALIDASAPGGGGQASPVSREKPILMESFEGPRDPAASFSDSVGAVGPTRFVNLVNEQFAIYDRTVSPPGLLSTGPLQSFAQAGPDVFNPNVIWDPGTQRFYYAMDHVASQQPPDFRIAWGFSMTDTPNAPSDWCHYSFDFGAYGLSGRFPDYPKLGDTADFVLIGVNVYPFMQHFAGSDVAWVSKPPIGSSCPAPGSFLNGVQQDVRQQDSSVAFTPVPANQIDDDAVGYVVANTDLGQAGVGHSPQVRTSDLLTVLTVTRNQDGTANITKVGRSLHVRKYKMPPSAPQKGTALTLDTLDGRLTNAQEAINPETGKAALYTQHTVRGKTGSEARVYVLDPVTLAFTIIKVRSTSLYVFNAAVSTDRVVNPLARPAVELFGDSIVVGFNTSSSTAAPAIQMVSQIDSGARSQPVQVLQSQNSDMDPSCMPVCPWGRYSGASPDPAVGSASPHGVVWLSNQWVGPPMGGSPWRTWNWSASP